MLYLKVLGDSLKNQSKSDTANLLRHLDLKGTKIHQEFVQSLIREGLPFKHSQLDSSFKLLHYFKNNPEKQTILKEMIHRKLPITKEIFQALSAVNNSNQSQSMLNLLNYLESNKLQIPLKEKLSQLTQLQEDKDNLKQFSNLHMGIFSKANPKEQFIQQLQRYLTTIGLDYEHRMKFDQNKDKQMSIKEMLLQLITKGNRATNKHASRLLYLINGLHINSVQESDNFLQAHIQVPSLKLGLKNDLELNFESQKTEEGKINPNYCRIYFNLKLAYLQETIIDMHIQQRSITMTIYNDTLELNLLTKTLQGKLNTALQELNFHLTSVNFQPLQEKSKEVIKKKEQLTSYEGVDLRI
ncbi:hypothetical protein [Oceanobacillus senegalensis]|uniref:hypothetical protein n=1 Tax=Oceanobacillus senegalensis TaxID=1936063 RepID=UPI001C4ED9B1|nr:hypothetical protein [Oceanobacillus senegalensis]